MIGSKVRSIDDLLQPQAFAYHMLFIAMVGRLDVDDMYARLAGLEISLASLRRESDVQKEELDELLNIYESSVSLLSLYISYLPVLF